MKTLDERFSEFYEKWLLKLEKIVLELLQVIRSRNQAVIIDSELQALLSKATSHMKEFYTMKWAEAREDCLPFFAPLWLTPLENSYLWVTGFKPSTMVFPLIDSMKNPPLPVGGVAPPSLFPVTPEQGRKIEELRIRTRMEEEKVDREMQSIQMCWSEADRRMEELAKLAMRVKNRNHGFVRVAQGNALLGLAMKQVIAALENAMKGADCGRLVVLKGVLDVLGPMQCVEFLASFLTLQLRLRQWGKTRMMDGSAGGATAPVTAGEATKPMRTRNHKLRKSVNAFRLMFLVAFAVVLFILYF